MREREVGELAIGDQTAEVEGGGRGAIGLAGVGRQPDGERADRGLVAAIGIGVRLAAVHDKGEGEVTGDTHRHTDAEGPGPGFTGGERGDGEGGPEGSIGGLDQDIAAPQQRALDGSGGGGTAVGDAHGHIEVLAADDAVGGGHELSDEGGPRGDGGVDSELIIDAESFGAAEHKEVAGGRQAGEGDAAGAGIHVRERADELEGVGAVEVGGDGGPIHAPGKGHGVIGRPQGDRAEGVVIHVARVRQGERRAGERAVDNAEFGGRQAGVVGLVGVRQEAGGVTARGQELVRGGVEGVVTLENGLLPEALLEDAKQGRRLDVGLDLNGEGELRWAEVFDGDRRLHLGGKAALDADQPHATGLHLALHLPGHAEFEVSRIGVEGATIGGDAKRRGGADRERSLRAAIELHPRTDRAEELFLVLDLGQRDLHGELRLQFARREIEVFPDLEGLVVELGGKLRLLDAGSFIRAVRRILVRQDQFFERVIVFRAALGLRQIFDERAPVHLHGGGRRPQHTR